MNTHFGCLKNKEKKSRQANSLCSMHKEQLSNSVQMGARTSQARALSLTIPKLLIEQIPF